MINQRKKYLLIIEKHLLILKIIAIIISVAVAIMIFCIISILHNDMHRVEGEELFGVFLLYDGEIYSDSKSKVSQADIKTFKSISDERYDRQVALDKNNVYCGSSIIPYLKPENTVALGGSYYTDGNLTYYCAPYTVSNDSLSILDLFWQEIQYQFFDTKRTETYFRPLIALPKSNVPYYTLPLLGRFVPVITNGTSTYYEGQLMKDANPKTLVKLNHLDENGRISKSFFYLSDGKNVYFENKKLAVTYNDSIYSFRLQAQNTEEYVINPSDGMVYLKDISFDKKNAPYKIISKYSAHTYQTLFLSDNGVYFYNSQKKSIEKAGRNPFLGGNYKEIAPLVFYNGKQTLFVDAIEHRGNSRNNRRLKSRSTIIYRLEENLTHNWQKFGDTKTGTIWKNGSNYFYFDEYGESQAIPHTIYRIRNQESVKNIIQNKKRIRELIESEELIPVKRKEIVEAKTSW